MGEGSDGIRVKDGKRLDYVFQTSINQLRQENQEIVKQACLKAGIGIEIKAVLASVYFSSDVGNPNTYTKFYTDLQMYTTNPGRPDPGRWMQQFLSTEVAQKSNKWQGRNIIRWRNAEFDKVWNASETEIDPVKRAAMLIRCNDLVIDDIAVIPMLFRMNVAAVTNTLRTPPLSGWDNDTSNIANWYKVRSA